jgi:hypothetical protein
VYAVPKVPPGGAALVMVGDALGVTETVPEAGPWPAAFVARTEHVYVTPPVSPVTTIGDAGPDALPLGVQLTA